MSGKFSFRKKKFPAQALNYAVKFNHPHVADAAAPLTIDRSGEGMHGELGGSPGAFLAWVRACPSSNVQEH